ncbi:MAG TPA: SURF1 family protein [Marmoricola sp.]|nr:SURF1 family protein [Marmoricola sp.]
MADALGSTTTLADVGFLLTRRWLLFFLAVLLMAWGATWLGQWQFRRLHEKRHDNHVIATNLAAAPVPVASLLRVGRPPGPGIEWRRVTAHGHWDDRHSLVVKYQTSRNGSPGVHVATPLVTDGGTAVLVDRGWMPTSNSGDFRPRLPPVTPGEVTVTGWVRQNATGDATLVDQMSTRALSSATAKKVLPYPVYAGVVDLARQSPPPVHRLGAIELPDDTSDGPHFFYGLQWWFFGLLAVIGFVFLAWDEWKRPRGTVPDPTQRARSMPPSTGTMAPETKEEAGLSRNAATRPNSSGSP